MWPRQCGGSTSVPGCQRKPMLPQKSPSHIQRLKPGRRCASGSKTWLNAGSTAAGRLSTDEQIIAEVGLYRQSRLNGFFSCAMNRLPHAAVEVLRALPEKSWDIVRL